MVWDIFCKVIDNLGDIGVCWRLAAQLAEREQLVRLRADDASALSWMAAQGHAGVTVLPWDDDTPPGHAVIEAFGCELPQSFQTALAQRSRDTGRQPAWINLEYLTAEPFAERSHGLPSPVLAGPAKGLTKRFFYPGFTPRTGGLLRETDLLARQSRFDRAAWLAQWGLASPGSVGRRRVSLFCYEPAHLPSLLEQLAQAPTPTDLLVTAGRSAAAARTALAGLEDPGHLSVTWLPLLPQVEFDHLLGSCDLNFVRGEDSLVRAIWAGRPFVWQLYPQDDAAHHAKLEAFLQATAAPAQLCRFHEAWNGIAGPLPPLEIEDWTAWAGRTRERMLLLPDLADELVRWAA
jgi:uncharacterized repeat protein (TIGR03837 family)